MLIRSVQSLHNFLRANLHAVPARLYTIAAAESAGGVLQQRYDALVSRERLRPDPEQLRCLRRFQSLLDELQTYTPSVAQYERDNSYYQEERRRRRQQLQEEERRQAQQAAQNPPGYLERLWSGWRAGTSGEASPMQQSIARARAREQRLDALLGPPPLPPRAPKGVFLYGSVGSGKTMLMDLACGVIEDLSLVPRLRRMHFNRAFDELHQRMHRLELARAQLSDHEMQRFAEAVALQERGAAQASGGDGGADPIPEDPVARKQKQFHQAKLAMRRLRAQAERKRKRDAPIGNSLILAKAALSIIKGGADVSLGWDEGSARAAGVLCFDEMQIADPFAAIALKGVFEALLDAGTVIVCTSNTPPWDLNPHGVAEELFDEFSKSLLAAMDPLELSVQRDYRLSFASQVGAAEWLPTQNYYFPLEGAAEAAVEEVWQRLLAEDGAQERAVTLPVIYGRSLEVARAGLTAARFKFDEICGHPLGPADYFALAQAFQTVLITDVPDFSLQMRDRARRFISLLDELYNARTRLIVSAASPPHLLFQKPGDVPILDLESLQFETAVEGSRLRRDLMADGSVAPVASSSASLAALNASQSGLTEAFAFARAVSRLYELTHMKPRATGLHAR